MKTQHTPGPWRMRMTQNLSEATGLIMGGEHGLTDICDMRLAYWYNRRAEGLSPEITNPVIEQGLANARLIAAAPELLEALKLLQAIKKVGYFAMRMQPGDEKRIVEAAIAKAEGN